MLCIKLVNYIAKLGIDQSNTCNTMKTMLMISKTSVSVFAITVFVFPPPYLLTPKFGKICYPCLPDKQKAKAKVLTYETNNDHDYLKHNKKRIYGTVVGLEINLTYVFD